MIVRLMSLLTIAFSQDLLNYKLYLFRISPYTCCSLRFLWKFFGLSSHVTNKLPFQFRLLQSSQLWFYIKTKTLLRKPLGDDIGIYEYEKEAFVHSHLSFRRENRDLKGQMILYLIWAECWELLMNEVGCKEFFWDVSSWKYAHPLAY